MTIQRGPMKITMIIIMIIKIDQLMTSKKRVFYQKGEIKLLYCFLRHGRNGIAVSNCSITGPLKCHNNLQTIIGQNTRSEYFRSLEVTMK